MLGAVDSSIGWITNEDMKRDDTVSRKMELRGFCSAKLLTLELLSLNKFNNDHASSSRYRTELSHSLPVHVPVNFAAYNSSSVCIPPQHHNMAQLSRKLFACNRKRAALTTRPDLIGLRFITWQSVLRRNYHQHAQSLVCLVVYRRIVATYLTLDLFPPSVWTVRRLCPFGTDRENWTLSMDL
jgi:hypothetical protein